MEYLDEYRDRQLAGILAGRIKETARQEWTLMEVCGGQTHTILKYNLPQLLPSRISLIHGPGCPVCVTPVEMIDRAITLTADPRITLVSFGDMLRVPGTEGDLLEAKARTGRVRMAYSPLDAVDLAAADPGREVVFFAVGFETTAPAVALAVNQARARRLGNFSILTALVLVPPAMERLLAPGDQRIQGLLAPGHVCTVMGTAGYEELAKKFRVPVVVTGFEPVDILMGISHAVSMLESGVSGLHNAYSRSVRKDGNPRAREMMTEVFTPTDRIWRGIGLIPNSGLELTDRYREFDAMKRFSVSPETGREEEKCMAGMILTGRKIPSECHLFGRECTPEHPMGAPMVSSEGACAAYHRYRPALTTGS